ncbi:MAG: T9SS type A sorting domain-containing protein [Bacteroidales bacterium]|nr:T9SS type A sorting domain-containing protein [Bacteroidales bacterium]
MKTKVLITVLIIFSIFSLNTNKVSAQWVQQNSETTFDLESVFFTDANTGYCTGVNPNTWVGSIYKTTNGGNTWDSLDVHPPAPYPIFFSDANTGYIGCYDLILKTTNAGSTWAEYQLSLGIVIFSIHFPDANTGYLVGNDMMNGLAVVLKTTNAGGLWTDISPTFGDEQVRCIHCTDVNTCYMGFSGSDITTFIMKTTNGGSTWIDISPPFTQEVWSIFFVDGNTGYATGQGDGGECQILKTTNAGNDWTEILSTNEFPHGNNIYFSDANIGCVVTDEGYILKTTNAGNTWNAEASSVSTDLNAVYFPNDEIGYIVGNNGVILKFDESAGIDNPVFPQKNNVIIYPNPFKTTATLKINEALQINNAELRIFDTYGKEVHKITNISNNEFEINRTGLSNGLYFYQLFEKQNIIDTGKIMID